MKSLLRITATSLLLLTASQAQADNAELTHYERLVVASCLVLEAASEGSEGMQAVLNVIHNRAEGDITRVMGVVCRPKQFTAMNSATGVRNPDYGPLIERATLDRNFSIAYDLVVLMESGQLEDITGGADHYHADHGEAPIWSASMKPTRTIGSHTFYQSTSADPALLAQVE
ncbi:cell wall hydrolase [Cerasicoccus fimbriatus]|uniref:cell wall hydrolase n=1 Tax=Cerasicoccus fimbriatus TaxID=3014554 RepID=UPI0022B47736|nr:cell wall hydrolase [Cerasicoccus sp. TK19100]